MSQISFSNNNNNFQELVARAKTAAQDGQIDDKELAELAKVAESGNSEQQNFIKALKNTSNVQVLNRQDFDPASFKMELNETNTQVTAKPEEEQPLQTHEAKASGQNQKPAGEHTNVLVAGFGAVGMILGAFLGASANDELYDAVSRDLSKAAKAFSEQGTSIEINPLGGVKQKDAIERYREAGQAK